MRDGAAAATAIGPSFVQIKDTASLNYHVSPADFVKSSPRRVVFILLVRLHASECSPSGAGNTETAWVMLLLGCVTLGLSFTGVVILSGGQVKHCCKEFSVAISHMAASL